MKLLHTAIELLDQLRDSGRLDAHAEQALGDLHDSVSLAGPRLVERARDEYQTDEIEIDDDAVQSRGDDPGTFVSAWIWVADPECVMCGEPCLELDDDSVCPLCLRDSEEEEQEELEALAVLDVPSAGELLAATSQRAAELDHLAQDVLSELAELGGTRGAAERLRQRYHDEGATGRYLLIDTLLNEIDLRDDDG